MCFHAETQKNNCKRVCSLNVFPHLNLYTWCSKISTFGMCFHQNMGKRVAHVYPHENTKMARERDCVSSSHHHRAWKRACLTNVLFGASLRLSSVAFLAETHPNRCFCQKLFTFRDQKLRKRYAAEKNGTCQNHMTNCEKKSTKFKAKTNTKDIT